MITGHQLAAARSLLGLALPDLAARAGLAAPDLEALERTGASGIPMDRPGAAAVLRALEQAGVRFLEDGGRGVQLKDPGPVDEGLRPEALNAENDD